MKEKIYTIPVNEAFEKQDGCPFCRLYRQLEKKEVDRILGAAMMEPEVRIQTNDAGFCGKHYRQMLHKQRRLQLGLILESHLDQLRREQNAGTMLGKHAAARTQTEKLQKLEQQCYLCARIEQSFQKMINCAAYLWGQTREFRTLVSKQPWICLPHYRRFMEEARRELDKKTFASFYEAVHTSEMAMLEKLNKDVSWFCKKFDYRYDDEPWYDAKDALPRAVKILSGEDEEEDTEA